MSRYASTGIPHLPPPTPIGEGGIGPEVEPLAGAPVSFHDGLEQLPPAISVSPSTSSSSLTANRPASVVTFAPGNKTSNDRRNRTPLPHFSLHPYDFLSLKLKNAEKLLFDGCFSKARIESFAFHMNYPGLFKRRLLQSTASFATRIKWYYNVSTLVVQFHGGRT